MPIFISFFIRQAIIYGTTFGLFELFDRVLAPLINSVVASVMSFFGVDKEEAKDILSNEIITGLEAAIGVIALSKLKLPLRFADALGFTTKGFAKRPLKPATAQKVAAATGTQTAVAALSGTLGKGILTVTGGLFAWNVLTDWVWIGNSLGFLPADAQNDIQKRALSIQQLINAPKSIIYSAEKIRRQLSQQERELLKTTADEAEKQIKELVEVYSQKFILYGAIEVRNQLTNSSTALLLELKTLRQMAGLIPRQPIEKTIIEAKVVVAFDGDTIKLDTGETVRLLGIDAPESTTPEGEVSKKYLKTRIEQKQVRIESDPNALIDIYGRRLGVIYLDDVNINIEMLQKNYASFYFFEPNALVFEKQWKAAGAVAQTQPSFIAAPRVFTGIISQGTLGAGVSFTPRPDDLIESIAELQTAAQNNLAPFLASLAGRVVYELKIVPSITTKDGFTQRGTAQRIVSGYTKAGTPKYRTVINKFAVLHLFILTERGTRTKISSIVLGPTDALKFKPEQNDIAKVEATIKSATITTNTAEIINITPPIPPVTAQVPALPISAPQAPAPTLQHPGAAVVLGASGYQIFEGASNSYLTGTLPSKAEAEKALAVIQAPTPTQAPATQAPATQAPATQAPAPAAKPGSGANTLYEWYTANAQSLPTVSARALIYAGFGLGQSAYYTGTAEQNTKLLAALKAN